MFSKSRIRNNLLQPIKHSPETFVHTSWYQHSLRFHIPYKGNYLWEAMLKFLERRAIPGVETVQNNRYYRTVFIKNLFNGIETKGWLSVENNPNKSYLKIEMSISLFTELAEVIHRIRHLFNLDANLELVNQLLNEPWMSKDIRLPGGFDGFEVSVRAVLGQQITVTAATTLAKRLVNALGMPFNCKISGLNFLFPLPETFINIGKLNQLEGGTGIGDVLGPLGITGRRAATIEALASGILQGAIHLHARPIWKNQTLNEEAVMKAEDEMAQLLKIKGIGPWSAQYIGMRALGYPDAFLETDVGVVNALAIHYPEIQNKKDRIALAESWHPFRSYAVMNLWS